MKQFFNFSVFTFGS